MYIYIYIYIYILLITVAQEQRLKRNSTSKLLFVHYYSTDGTTITSPPVDSKPQTTATAGHYGKL